MKKFLSSLDSTVLSMAGLRFVSASIEFCAAILILLFNDVKKAIVINSLLAVVGPVILITSMTLGLIKLAGDISLINLLFIAGGVGLILIGIYR
ncbi:DUF2619 domain-containing protein [Bacillus sp. HMF5848]|uniref:YqhV family protein n=1 Tax=Bacillus sp. HMF5848 TaxID=2495421 RepID=UPI000F7A1085|nr:YqhV family protein [Bacillus sp. HMF5848]RSK27807.1 DUF2619 domain-containing protein [Bacillus sp. HMF5848]